MSTTIQTRFTDRYGVRHPFASAGLAFAGMTPDLAIAVGAAGGVGALGVGPLPPEAMTALVGAIQAASSAPLNVNFITIFTTDAHIAACCELRPRIVSFHWGHPPKAWIERLHAAGCDVWEQVGSADAARRAVDDGVDAVIAQGTESGGHNYGELPTFVLTPEIVRAVAPTLVLAAGGIVDGPSAAAALCLGADAVWVGTRLVASVEASAAQGYKDRLVAAKGADTTLASLWGRESPVHFNPMRVLRNAIVAEWGPKESETPTDLEAQPIVGAMELMGGRMPIRRFANVVPMASFEGDCEQVALLSGQGVGAISSIEPVAVIIEQMMRDAADRLQALAGAVR
jgi:NAD(P)H-dependent flavin oxidoreductase YrpB (nitropropane dioxygenase family)